MAIEYRKQPPAEPVSLSKVTLTKSAPSVSLSKSGSGFIQVNLNWHQGGQALKPRGLFKRAAPVGDVDLDLGCLFELTDGSKGVVQALGNAFTAYGPSGRPIIRLDGDDRSGANSAGENLFIDLAQSDLIRRVLIFAHIYEGSPNWAQADGVVTLTQPAGPSIEVRLDESDPTAPSCAIALLTNERGVLHARREVRYVRGAQDAVDRAYGWGMTWTPGRK